MAVPFNRRFRLRALALVFFLALAGCASVGPDYAPPEVKAPERWNAAMEGGLATEGVDTEGLSSWWTTLEDPVLTELVELAIKNNLDLREARARVREARARRGVAGAELLPTIDATGSASFSRGSENAGSGESRELYAAGFDARWELDIFGGIRRSVEAAEAELEASEEGFRDTLVTLLSEVALNYVDARLFQARLSVARANLETQEETYGIAEARYLSGLAGKLDEDLARLNLESTRASIPALETGLEQAKNRLALLLGQNPGYLRDRLSGPGPIPATPVELAVGIPAETLRRRPDVRRAERELAAQTARVGAATAELYPEFNLPGSIGLESLSARDLFSADSVAYSILPSVRWNIFDRSRIRGNIEVHSALQEQALARYEAAVLAALEDVENALVAFSKEQERRSSLKEASRAASSAAELSNDLYASGLTDFLDVLDAERSLLSLQDQLAVSEAEVTSNLLRLYKALGGGWTPPQTPIERKKE